jgi:hypothetical protein
MDTETPTGFGIRIERCQNKVEAYVAKVVDGAGLTWDPIYGYDVHDVHSLGTALWAEYSYETHAVITPSAERAGGKHLAKLSSIRFDRLKRMKNVRSDTRVDPSLNSGKVK